MLTVSLSTEGALLGATPSAAPSAPPPGLSLLLSQAFSPHKACQFLSSLEIIRAALLHQETLRPPYVPQVGFCPSTPTPKTALNRIVAQMKH